MNICLKISEIQAVQKECFEILKSGADTTQCIRKLRFTISQTVRGLFAESRISEIKRKEWSTPQEYLDHSFAMIEKLKNTDSAEMLKLRNEIAHHSLKIQLVPEPAKFDVAEEKATPVFENIKIAPVKSFPQFLSENLKTMVNSQYCEPGEPMPQTQTIEFANRIEKAQARSFGVEIENERRIFYKESPIAVFDALEKLGGQCNPVHEVIDGQCRFFVDIDDKTPIMNRAKFSDYINILMGIVPSYFNKFFGLADNYFNFYVAISENPAYNSAHIYFDVFCLKTFAVYESKSPRDQGSFWSALVHHADKKLKTEFARIVDLSIYKNKAQLRLPMTRKNGFLLRPLIAPVMFPVHERAQYDTKNEFREILDNGTMTRELVKSETTFIGGENKNYFQDAEPTLNCFCANTQWIDNVKVLESPKIATTVKHYTEYEKILFERVLRCSALDIKSQTKFSNSNVFSGACYRIFCFYKTQPLENRINIATSYLKSKNVNLPVNKLFDEWESSGAYHAFSIDTLKKFFDYQPVKKIIVNERHFKYPVWSGVLLLKSGTGTGKTYGFIEKVKDSTALFISCRISLSDEFKRSAKNQGIDMVHYLEKPASAIIAEKPNHFCVQINSLYKFADILDHYDFVFIDESEALFSLFSHINATNPRSLSTLKVMMREIMETKKVVLCSANLGDRTFEFVENFKVPFYYIENEILDKAGYSCQPQDVKSFFKYLGSSLNEGKKCVVPVSTIYSATCIRQYLEDTTKARVLVQTSETQKIPIEQWTNYDCVIYTSTIETGVSINYQYFDQIHGFFSSGVNTYDSCYQMLFRVRHPNNKTIFICTDADMIKAKKQSATHSSKLPDRFDLKRATQKIVMDSQDNNATITRAEKIELFEKYTYRKLRDPIDKIMISNELFRNYSKTYFTRLLFSELKAAGVEFLDMQRDKEKIEMPAKDSIIAEMDMNADDSCGEMKQYLGICEMVCFGDITQKNGLAVMCSIKNLAIGAKLSHREYACKLLVDFIGDQALSSIQIDAAISEFFKKYYGAVSACFGKRKYTLEHLLKMKPHHKIQHVANILKVCGLEFETSACFTRITLNSVFKSKCEHYKIPYCERGKIYNL